MPKVAFITEVYNAAPTLAQAAESILAQTQGDFVCFIGDDASTDGTPALIRQLAARDERIVPSLFETHDMLANFNHLLEQALESGAEYLAILDGDDWLEPDFLETLLPLAEESGADVAMARFAPHNEAGQAIDEPLLGFGDNVACTMPQFCEEFPACSMFPTTWQWWGKLFRISRLKSAGLRATEAWDVGFCASFYLHCQTLLFCERVLLHYRCRDESDSHHQLQHYDTAKEARVQTKLHALREELLKKHECKNPFSWQMAAFHDLREAYIRLLRLVSANMPAAAIAAGIEGTLALPFLPKSYRVLTGALANEATPFGAPKERAAALIADQSALLAHCLLFWRQNSEAAKTSPLLATWTDSLRTGPAAFFRP